jgi:hypothetical protein
MDVKCLACRQSEAAITAQDSNLHNRLNATDWLKRSAWRIRRRDHVKLNMGEPVFGLCRRLVSSPPTTDQTVQPSLMWAGLPLSRKWLRGGAKQSITRRLR